MDFDPETAYNFGLLPLCAWREAQNQGYLGMLGVCWNVLNRAAKPGWWGKDVPSCILHPFQYSSFNPGDPNSKKFPQSTDPPAVQQAWQDALRAAHDAFTGAVPDPTNGSLFYHDSSIATPSVWGPVVQTAQIGTLTFYKLV